jgi:hypothetical protein
MSRASVLLPVALLLVPFASAKDKNKSVLPADILRAETVLVVIDPDAGEPVTDPMANRRAQEEVEQALSKWGRFRLVMEPQTADLVIVVRKGTGRLASPTIKGLPTDNRPVIVEPGANGDARIGGQRGQTPGLNQPGIGTSQGTGPSAQTEIGSSDDTLQVYRGKVEYPLDSPAVWRYMAKDALRPPAVPAIEQFRKAIDDSEKALAQKHSKQKP